MIKLFWNTHNQNKFNSNKYETKKIDSWDKKEVRDQIWGKYHKNYSDKWIYEILKKIQFKIIENEKDLENGDILIIIDSSVEKKGEFYTKLELVCSKMFLIHLGDEESVYDLSMIYSKFQYVWRTFCINKYFNNKKIGCLPIGYKSGTHLVKNIEQRKYKWVFIGTPHKSSRHDLLFQLADIEPSFSYKTKEFDKKLLDVDQMSEILTSTEFVPCPNGMWHPETYRLYEALECGCIPIVEDTYKYYDRLFPNNPFLKVNKWLEAKFLIKEWKSEQVDQKREECKSWWKQYKNYLQNFISNKINL